MIVVDTNVIAYLLLPTPYTDAAERLLEKDGDWVAPLLWRSELRSVLALNIRKGIVDLAQALRLQDEAEALLHGREYEVPSSDVLKLATGSGCSAYDCEFVALAQGLGVLLVTMDRKLIESFPGAAVGLMDYVATQ